MTSEVEERHNLVGFCESCQKWYEFVDDAKNHDVRNCPKCGGRPSTRTGFQLTTRRTFNPSKKLSKTTAKKMSMGA